MAGLGSSRFFRAFATFVFVALGGATGGPRRAFCCTRTRVPKLAKRVASRLMAVRAAVPPADHMQAVADSPLAAPVADTPLAAPVGRAPAPQTDTTPSLEPVVTMPAGPPPAPIADAIPSCEPAVATSPTGPKQLKVLEYARPGRRPLLSVGAPPSSFAEFVAFKHGRSADMQRVRETSMPLDTLARARLKRAWDGQRLLVGLDAPVGLLRPSGETPAAKFERELETYAKNAARIRADWRALRAARSYMVEHGAPRAGQPAPTDAAKAEEHVRALLNWFGDRFHYYHLGCMHVDCPTPGRGSSKPEHVICLGSVAPRRRERWWTRASRAELHLCVRSPEPVPAEPAQGGGAYVDGGGAPPTAGCGRVSRFVRMNSFSHIAEARRGRCGEYSYAWLCFLRAAGYNARWVADWRDHVWCEVQLPGSSRWVHTDPCERAFDQPRLYADGWGKRHDYVVAFSEGECVDVTAQYAKDAETWQAEREMGDEVVAAVIANVNARLQGEVAGRWEPRAWLPQRRMPTRR